LNTAHQPIFWDVERCALFSSRQEWQKRKHEARQRLQWKAFVLIRNAIRQIQDNKYAERYAHDPRPCWLLGIGFVDKTMGYKLVKKNGGKNR
jgi:hypothetical protein